MKFKDVDIEFTRNMRKTHWLKHFPHWWSEDALIKSIGEEISYTTARYLYGLMNSGIKPPVLLWKTDVVDKEYNINKNITRTDNIINLEKAPFYKTWGIIKIKNNTKKDINNLCINITENDAIIISNNISEGDLITLDIEKQKFTINDKPITPNIIGEGFPYFIPTQRNATYQSDTPLTNDTIKVVFNLENDTVTYFDFDVDITLYDAVFTIEQNIEITSLELFPIEKIELFGYYDFPFNQNYNGWKQIFTKNYGTKSAVVTDLLTTKFPTKIFYVNVKFRNIDKEYSVGFPQYGDIDIDSIHYINTHLDEWGDILGLPRRIYRTDIQEEEYKRTFPIYYPYDIEQDFWYYSRLINEYCWNDMSINDVNILDTDDNTVMVLHSIDPFVQDLVVHTQSNVPVEIENIDYTTVKTPSLIYETSSSTPTAQASFNRIVNLFDNDENYATLTLHNYSSTYVTDETYKSKELDLFFNLKDLPPEVLITGFEFIIDTESTDNSDLKYNDERTRVEIYDVIDTTEDIYTIENNEKHISQIKNSNKKIYHSEPIGVSDIYELQRKKIIYGSKKEKFGLGNTITIDDKEVDLRDALYDHGLHFILSFINDSVTNMPIISLYNIGVKVYYTSKQSLVEIDSDFKYNKDVHSNILGYLSTTIHNVGNKTLSTDVNYFLENNLQFESQTSPYHYTEKIINLQPKNSITIEDIPILKEYPLADGQYEILTICENTTKTNIVNVETVGLINSSVICGSLFGSHNDTNIQFNVEIKALDGTKIDDSSKSVLLYIDDYFIEKANINQGIATFTIDGTEYDAGFHNVKIEYQGNDIYKNSTTNTTLFISKISTTTIVIPPTTAYTGQSTILEARVSSIDKQNINEGAITFYINNNEGPTVLVEDGKAIASLSLKYYEPGEYSLKAVFKGTINFGSSESETDELILTGGTTNINLLTPTEDSTGNIIKGYINKDINLKVNVKDINNHNVTQGIVSFYVNDEKIGEANVDNLGNAFYIYNPPEKLIPIDNAEEIMLPLKIEYEDNENVYYSSQYENEVNLLISRLQANITLYNLGQYQYEPMGFLIKVESGNNVVNNGKILLYTEDNKLFCQGDVDKDGYARLIYYPLTYNEESWEGLELIHFETKEQLKDNGEIVCNLCYSYDDTNTNISYFNGEFKLIDGYLYLQTDDEQELQMFYIKEKNNKKYLYLKTNDDNLTKEIFDQGQLFSYREYPYLYKIVYLPDNTYCRAESYGQFVIEESNVDNDLFIHNVEYGEQKKIVARISSYDFMEDDDITIEDVGKVSFYIDNVLIQDNVSINNGEATLQLNDCKEYTDNTHLLAAQYYTEDKKYSNTLSYNLLNISKTSSVIEVDYANILPNKTGDIYVTVKNNNINQSNLNTTGEVQLYLNDEQKLSYNLTENDNNEKNEASHIFNIEIPEDIDSKKYNIKIVYNGNDYINGSVYEHELIRSITTLTLYSEEAQIKNKINKYITKINISADNESTIPNGYIELYLDDNDEVIAKNSVVDGVCLLEWNVDFNENEIGNHTLIAKFSPEEYIGTEYILYNNNPLTIPLKIISSMDTCYIDNNGDNQNNGTKDAPFKTIQQGLNCVKDGGTIYLNTGTHYIDSIVINQNIKFIGENETTIQTNKDLEIINLLDSSMDMNINKNYQKDDIIINNYNVSFNNIHFNNKEINLNIKNYGNLNIYHSIVNAKVNIKNLLDSKLIANNNLFYGNIQNNGELNVENNWWGENAPKYNASNYIILNIRSNIPNPTIAENIYITASFIGANNKIYDLPSVQVDFISTTGILSITNGSFIDNQLTTLYTDAIQEDNVLARVDNQIVSLKIYDYDRHTTTIIEPYDIPIGNKIPIYCLVKDGYNNNVNKGYVIFSLIKDDNISKLGTSNVQNGKATIDVYFDNNNYSIDEYKIKAQYYSDDYYFISEDITTLNIIDVYGVIYVDPVLGNDKNNGSFFTPKQSIQESILNNASTIYLHGGVYDETKIQINQDVVIKKYHEEVIFDNTDDSIFIIEENKTLNLYGLTFKNNNKIINNDGILKIDNCLFYDNNICIQNNGTVNTEYSAIVDNNVFIDNYNTDDTINYNWWGENNPNFKIQPDNWIIMDFTSSKNPIKLGTITTLTASIFKYIENGQIYNLPNDKILPLRLALFDSLYGSLTPLMNSTYHNYAQSLFNTNKETISNKIFLTLPENINYINNDIILGCYVQDAYNNNIENGSVIFYIDNILIQEIGVDDGYASIIIPSSSQYPENTYEIKCVYYDENHIQRQVIFGNFIIKKPEILINNIVFDTEGTLNHLVIKANDIKDSFDNIIYNQKINIYLDGNLCHRQDMNNIYDYFVIENGILETILSFNTITSGNHTISIQMPETKEYCEFNQDYIVNIPKQDVEIVFDYDTIPLDKKTTLKILIKEKNTNKFVKDGTLDLFINNAKNPITLLINNGVATYTHTFTSVNNFSLIFYYHENEYYNSQLFIKNNINTVTKDIIIHNPEIEVLYNENIIINKKITDILNTSVQDGIINIMIDDIEVSKDIVIEDGMFSVEIPNVLEIGTHKITYQYIGKDNKETYIVNYDSILTVIKHDTQMISEPIQGTPGTKALLKFKIYDNLGVLVTSGKVKVYYNGDCIGETQLSVVSRQHSMYVNIPQNIDVNDNYYLNIQYEGTDIYNSSVAQSLLSLNKSDVNIQIPNIQHYPNEEFVYNFTFKDNDDNDINIGQAIIYIDNIRYDDIEIHNGVGFCPITFDNVGTHQIKIIYQENAYYQLSIIEKEINVVKIPIKDINLDIYDETGEQIVIMKDSILDTKVLFDIPNGHYISDGVIEVIIGDKTTTFNMGENNQNIYIDIPLNINSIQLKYINSNIFEYNDVKEIDLIVSKQNANMSFNSSSIETLLNDDIIIQTNFNNDTTGLVRYYLEYNENIEPKFIGVVNVENGKASYLYTLTQTYDNNNIKIIAEYSGDLKYKEEVQSCDLLINPIESFIEIKSIIGEDGTSNIQYMDNIDIEVETINIPDNKPILLYIDDIYTDIGYIKNNKYYFNYELKENNKNNMQISIKYEGSSVIQSSITTQEVLINKGNLFLNNENDIDIYKGQNLVVNYHVVDINNKPITRNGTFNCTIDGNIYNLSFNRNRNIGLTNSNILNVKYIPNNEDYNNLDIDIHINYKNNIIKCLNNINGTYYRGELISQDLEFKNTTSDTSLDGNNVKVYINNQESNTYVINNNKITLNEIIPTDNYTLYNTLKIYVYGEDIEDYEQIFNINLNMKDNIYVDSINGDNNNNGDENNPISTITQGLNMVSENGTIYLMNDIQENITINKNVTINGNGYKITNLNTNSIIVNNNNTILQNIIFEGSDIESNGGCIYNNSKLYVDSCSFNNTDIGNKMGGAIYSNDELTIIDSDFNNNKSESGGAIYISPSTSTVLIKQCSFNNNISGFYGGAITSYNGNNISIIQNYFNQNTSIIEGDSIVIIGNGLIKDNSFIGENNSNESQITIISGDVNIETNIFSTHEKTIKNIDGNVFANFNYLNKNNNIQDTIIGDIKIENWLVSDFTITPTPPTKPNVYKITPKINKYININNPDSFVEIDIYTSIPIQYFINDVLNDKIIYINQDEIIVDANDNKKIVKFNIGQEEFIIENVGDVNE